MGCNNSKPDDAAATGGVDKSKLLESTTNKATPTSTGDDGGRRSMVHKAPELGSGGGDMPYDPAIIGCLSRHGIAPARLANATSKAKINQDRGMVCWPFNGTHDQALLAVFDGHGMQGERISEWCVHQIPQRLEADRLLLNSDPASCISKAVIAMDEELLAHSSLGQPARGAGTTSNILYFHGDRVFTACSGDSRAVLGCYGHGGKKKGKIIAKDLSRDHKPDLPEERKRIEKAGGVVSQAGPRGLPPSRVWVNGRVGLAMSRSIGDGEAKGSGVIPDPEIVETKLKPCVDATSEGDAFIIVASDGIWEFISSQQACEVIQKHADNATAGCEELVKLAVDRWMEEEGSYRDDITCIIAFLPFLEDRPDESYETAPGVVVDDASIFLQADQGDSPGKPVPKQEANHEDFAKRRLSVAGANFDPDQDTFEA